MIITKRRVPIYGMSLTRNTAIKRITNCSETFRDHLVKCVVYENTTGDFNKWT